MAVFFTSDLHLGHKNIISMCNRKFNTVDEMDEYIINRWNAKVNPEDEVYILGDLSYRSSVSVKTYLKKMHGRLKLIVGNHDHMWIKNVENLYDYFELVSNMELIQYEDKYITLCHYPLMEWSMSNRKNSWLIHGHIHDNRSNDTFNYIKEHLPQALNAGVDINNFEPVTFEELEENNRRWYGRRNA